MGAELTVGGATNQNNNVVVKEKVTNKDDGTSNLNNSRIKSNQLSSTDSTDRSSNEININENNIDENNIEQVQHGRVRKVVGFLFVTMPVYAYDTSVSGIKGSWRVVCWVVTDMDPYTGKVFRNLFGVALLPLAGAPYVYNKVTRYNGNCQATRCANMIGLGVIIYYGAYGTYHLASKGVNGAKELFHAHEAEVSEQAVIDALPQKVQEAVEALKNEKSPNSKSLIDLMDKMPAGHSLRMIKDTLYLFNADEKADEYPLNSSQANKLKDDVVFEFGSWLTQEIDENANKDDVKVNVKNAKNFLCQFFNVEDFKLDNNNGKMQFTKDGACVYEINTDKDATDYLEVNSMGQGTIATVWNYVTNNKPASFGLKSTVVTTPSKRDEVTKQ